MKAFTLIEILVALALVAIMLAISTVVFKKAVETQRVSSATAEISSKLNVITAQLKRDLDGIRKDSEIVIVWRPGLAKENGELPRFDVMMFYTQGSFETFDSYDYADGNNVINGTIKGNLARVTYGLADIPNGTSGVIKPELQPPAKRMLYRNMHVVTNYDVDNDGKSMPYDFNSPSFHFSPSEFLRHNVENEYDEIGPSEWMSIPLNDKMDIWTIITDVEVQDPNLPSVGVTPGTAETGILIDMQTPKTLHNLLCRGVGQFKIQGWYYDTATKGRWVPEVDPDGDGNYSDSDFYTSGATSIDYNELPGVIYPRVIHKLNNGLSVDSESLVIGNFNNIPGLGRALKFTFTIYDSEGVIADGKTFTYIAYLDE